METKGESGKKLITSRGGTREKSGEEMGGKE